MPIYQLIDYDRFLDRKAIMMREKGKRYDVMMRQALDMFTNIGLLFRWLTWTVYRDLNITRDQKQLTVTKLYSFFPLCQQRTMGVWHEWSISVATLRTEL